MSVTTGQRFWRDDALPFIEARSVQDGRGVCYAPHAHDTFSIGAILEGSCRYMNRANTECVDAGTVVLMNPGDVHACNPIRDEPWAYRMVYVDALWIARVQQTITGHDAVFQPFAAVATRDAALFRSFNRLYDVLVDPQVESSAKSRACVSFMSDLLRTVDLVAPAANTGRVVEAAQFIRDNCTRSLGLKDVCAAVQLSPSYLIRAFKVRFGMSPHAYLVNCRIEFSRQQLRLGRPLAEVALAAGFCDQAHLQRSFKKLVAATPGQYRS